MSDWIQDQYEEYLEDFRAWGHEFFTGALTYGQFEHLQVESESIDIDEEFNSLTETQKRRRDEIERLLLTHEDYFSEGPRISITFGTD